MINFARLGCRWVLFGVGFVVGTASAAERPLLLEETFEAGADRWKPTDPAAWKLVDGRPGHGRAFALFQQSKYKPPFRSPFNIALADDAVVTDFRLEADVRSTVKEYPHRSMTVIFGYQDPAHFYYVHIASRADDHANQIFIVDGEPRKKISTRSTPGTKWTDDWHHVKVERDTSSGEIKIYFDDMAEPCMTAVDKTFAWGKVGLGSFDDLGEWDDVKLWGVKKP